MKKVLAFIACFTFFVSFALPSEPEGTYSYSFARLSYVRGDVFIQRAEDLGYEEGVVNLPVVEGDKLGTREGRAEIHFGKRNYLRIESYTQIDFVRLPRRGYDQIKLHLLSGNVYLRINFLEEEKSFEIHTPDASFYTLEEGLYRFEVKEDKETELLVYEGEVEAAGEEGSLLVRSEQKLIASNGYFSSDPIYFYASFDDSFSRWNRSRDALHARAITKKYLPPELNEYEVELAYNGRWVYERPYGHVWVPYVYHAEWRPYYYGRWIWYPVMGWNWVSYDPWGWCVYHYGRWHWRLGLGWHWIPTRIWGPAWVHWWQGYDYIGWCPLSYYGYPVVIVNNIFYGRYNGRYYPNNSRALTVVHKKQLQAPRISRTALSKNELSKLRKISLSAKQPGVKPVIRRTSLKKNVAAKVLSRSNIRSVKKSYISGKTLSPSRSRSTQFKSSSRVLPRTGLAKKGRSVSKESARISGSRISARSPAQYKSKLSAKKSQSSRHISSTFPRSHRSGSKIKTYPSRQISSKSLSRAISSSRKRKSLYSNRARSDSGRDSSSRIYSSRLRKKAYTRSGRSSRSFASSFPSLRKRTTTSFKLRTPKASSIGRRSTSRVSYSSSRYRPSFSRSISSRSTKISTSKRYSSRSLKSSSSRSRVSYSSSQRSSSRSLSGKNLKKK